MLNVHSLVSSKQSLLANFENYRIILSCFLSSDFDWLLLFIKDKQLTQNALLTQNKDNSERPARSENLDYRHYLKEFYFCQRLNFDRLKIEKFVGYPSIENKHIFKKGFPRDLSLHIETPHSGRFNILRHFCSKAFILTDY